MISAESKKDRYLIRFRGKKHQFNEYINKVMKLPDIIWDLNDRCWTIPKSSLKDLQRSFKNIDFLDEVSTDDNIISKQKITGYEDMGKSMKLSPYEYQKEAIKFSIDNLSSLLVLPCGSGKVCI